MRRPIKKKNSLSPDLKFNNLKVAKLINYVMLDGKKETARSVVYDAFDIVKDKTGEDPIMVFETAVKNVEPIMEVRSRRVGGANYQVPVEVRPERRLALALRWIVTFARKKSGMPMSERLAAEIMSAYKEEGESFKKKEDTHKMAEANKAFAHLAW
jgi:small subunit ribosomal protein S7